MVGGMLLLALLAGAGWLWTPDKDRAQLEALYSRGPADFVTVLGVRVHVRDSGPDVPRLARLMTHVLPKPLLRMSLEPAYADPTRIDAATVTRYHDMMRAPQVRTALLQRMGQVVLRDPLPPLRSIRAPTLLLWGEQDALIPIANAQDYLRALPDARLVSLPGVGHLPHEEAAAVALPPLRQFLAE